MSFKTHLHFLLLFVLVALASCSETHVEDSVTILSPSGLEISSEGGSVQISFSASNTWTAQFISSTPDDWCSISQLTGESGTHVIIIEATKNDTDRDRTAILRISVGDIYQDFALSQHYIEYLKLLPEEFMLGPESQTISVLVNCNFEVKVLIPTDCDWIHSLEQDISSPQFSFFVDDNKTENDRITTVSFSGGETGLFQNLLIRQRRKEIIVSGFDTDISIPGYGNNDW